jgi:anti-sigma-K factor RskA
MSDRTYLDCEVVDELGAAFGLGAVSPDEQRAIVDHLESCPRPHDAVRSALGAGLILAAAADPEEPSPALRHRLMASVSGTPQEHRTAPAVAPGRPAAATPARRGWRDWLSPGMARGLAVASLAAVVLLGAWNVTLQAQLGSSQAISSALGDARAVYPVSGEIGRGLLIDVPDGPRFLATDLASPPSDRVYVLWLIGEDGVPVDVGVMAGGDGFELVPIEDDLEGYVTFAVTVESARVDAPTTDPVLVATLEAPGS